MGSNDSTPRSAARCSAETMAFSDADTMLASMPTPNRVSASPTRGPRALAHAVLALEDVPQLRRGQLLAAVVHHRLHDLAELDLQAARQLDAVLRLEQVRDAPLPRLAVDADHRVVAAAEVFRIDR